jgi:NADH:ubiquinone oxidoreductase subunit K
MGNPGAFSLFAIAAVLVFIAGLYGIIASRNLIRTVICVEILAKAVTLLIITAGYFSKRIALAQTLAITVIIIEVAVTAVAVGMVLSLFRHDKSIDVTIVRNLKG